jgi:two-component system, OmpR family, sensor histidine kinase KdpD
MSLVRAPKRGRLKVYIGSAAGVGKSYRMLQEAHELRGRGVDVVVGFIETHGRRETDAQVGDLEVLPRLQMAYRGVTLDALDLEGLLARHPAVAIIDELPHTNVPGLRHAKRWEDVLLLLEAGISVITAMNVQHLESLHTVVQQTLGLVVRETVPDWVLSRADQVVNIDLTAADLRQRLVEGKIYRASQIPLALENFFTEEHLTTLRELALREVASSVDREREGIVRRETGRPVTAHASVDRIMVGMASRAPRTALLLQKASRIAGRLNSDWYCVYVQTPQERADRIDPVVQRRLVEHMQMAQRMGADVVKLEGADVAGLLCQFALEHGVSLIVIGQSYRPWWIRTIRPSIMDQLVHNRFGLDVQVVGAEAIDAAADAAPVTRGPFDG